jgi:hypothetical protein
MTRFDNGVLPGFGLPRTLPDDHRPTPWPAWSAATA